MSHTHIATSVTDLVCNHIKCDMSKKTILLFLILPIHHALLFTPVCLKTYFGLHSLPGHILSVSRFATSSSVSLKSSIFFFWLPLIYAFSLSSTCYTLLFTLTLINSLRSTPWCDLFPVLSFWAYDFSPKSLCELHLFPFHHVWETCCPTHFTPPYFAVLLPWHSYSPHPIRNT